jgi:hypothetical protein
MAEFTKQGYWSILPYRLLMNILTDLGIEDLVCLLPPGVVEKRERRPFLICDFSLYEVNQDTHQIGPEEAMQFARELERLMYTVWHANPRFGPVYMGKVDLADSFYRLRLALLAMLKLAVIFPSYPDKEELIALPSTLPMGWVNSVPYFQVGSLRRH